MKRYIFVLFAALLCITACHNKPTADSNTDEPEAQVDSIRDPLVLLNDSIALDENRVDLYLKRAQVYVEREQIGMAMMDVNTAIQLDPNNVDAFLLLSDLYYMLGDESNITAALNRALEVDPFDTRPMVKLAELNLLQQNFNLAFGYTDNAIKVNTYNPKAYYVRGMTYLAKADTASALRNLMIAREQDESFYEPQREICAIYGAQHDPMAESFKRALVNSFPEQPVARYELALFLQDNGKPEEALAHYDTLLMLQPDNSMLLFNKGYVYFVYLFDNAKALEYFDQALQANPDYIDALYNKGHVLERMGDFAQAKAIYTQVLVQQPNYRLAIDGMNRVTNQE